jgi:mannose-6-phosphate isomerase-like protein (cupin superfamily)
MDNQRERIAPRIRALREAAGLAAADVARAAGVAAGDYDRYESGAADTPMGVISQLAALFKVDAAAILTGGDAHAHAYFVTRRGTGPSVDRRLAYHYESLGAGFAHRTLEPFLVTVQPKPDSAPERNAHPGQEFNLVLKGRLEFAIDGHAVVLKSGDSVYFDSSRPHGMRALGGKPAQFLAVITTPHPVTP